MNLFGFLNLWLFQHQRCLWCGGWCQVSGVVSDQLAQRELSKDLERDATAADKAARRATKDHIIPRSMGGSGGAANTCVACFKCNQERGDVPHALAPNAEVLQLLPRRKQKLVRLVCRG